MASRMIRSGIWRCCAAIRPLKVRVTLSHVVIVSPYNFEVWVFMTHMFIACADMRIRSAHLSDDEYMRVTKQFHFLVALGAPGSDTSEFSE